MSIKQRIEKLEQATSNDHGVEFIAALQAGREASRMGKPLPMPHCSADLEHSKNPLARALHAARWRARLV